jgi:PASTA domain/IPT/TIG domain
VSVSRPLARALMIFAVALLGSAPLAQAQTTIGQLAPPNPSGYCINGPFDGGPLGPAATAYTAPFSGVVTSWSTNATAGEGQQLTFKVIRPVGAIGKFTIIAHDGPRTLTPSTLNTFSTALPIQAGDLIMTNDVNATDALPSACLFETGNFEDAVVYTAGDAPDGSTIEAEDEPEFGVRFNLTATILGAPTVTALSATGGSIKGGTAVVLTGSNFADVKAISFGTTPAAGFTVSSEGQLTAVSPPSTTLASVPITVTTVAGTVTSAQVFAYEGCKVPKLKGKKLKGAKKQLRKKDCRAGKVKKLGDATAKTGKVTKQKPAPGRLLPPGTKVKVTLK